MCSLTFFLLYPSHISPFCLTKKPVIFIIWNGNSDYPEREAATALDGFLYNTDKKTCRRIGKLACNCPFPFWSILESYIHSYQTWFKWIKGFAKTDTVKI